MTMTMPLVEVREYKNVKVFELDAQQRMSAGWTLQGQSGDSGHVGLGGAAAGYLVAGLPGMIGLQGMRKGKTVVTWIHPNPSAWQVRACDARRRGKRRVHIDGPRRGFQAWAWGITFLVSLFAAAVFAPILILTLVSVFGFFGAMKGGANIPVAEAY